ncbi:MAG TPA: alpha/beta fold hydrolase [Thermodesulfovibrionales bacterium]|nr:alpha/beta fold hydrolase [Thermodesulfovibrionales bacterium]
MKLDTTIIEGSGDKPAVVFIHGLGMDQRIWVSPQESRLLGGRVPVSLLVSEKPERLDTNEQAEGRGFSFGTPPENLTTLFHDLKERGHTVITWNQQRPASGIRVAVSELRRVTTLYRDFCKSGIILIGHSRGGLIARAYLASGDDRVRSLLTLATPHKGSRMALWATYLSPVAALLNQLLFEPEKGTVSYTIKRIAEFLSSRAVKELLPDALFFRSLNDKPIEGVRYFSAGGKDPKLFSLYRMVPNGVEEDGMKPQEVLSFPQVFENVIPERFLPDEMKNGKGDGLVSLESSRLPWDHEHRIFAVNHAGILFHETVRSEVMNFLERRGLRS